MNVFSNMRFVKRIHQTDRFEKTNLLIQKFTL
jgi:hypothetical protein